MSRTGSPTSRRTRGSGRTAAARLVVSAPASLAGSDTLLAGGAVSVGRSPDADLVLPLPTVSDRHARLWPEEGRWWVIDAGSAAGTRVNGRSIGNAPYRLDDGDRIGLAEAELTFQTAPGATTARSTLGGPLLKLASAGTAVRALVGL